MAAISAPKKLNHTRGQTQRSYRTVHDILPAIIFLLPGIALFITFLLGPMLYSLRLSFYDWNILRPDSSIFIGLKNYIEALKDPIFRRSVGNTLTYTVITVTGQMVLGLGVAMLLNQKVRGRPFFRLAYYLPVISSWVIVSVLFQYLFNGQAGFVNWVLKDLLHLTNTNIRWLISPTLIFVPLTAMAIWKGVGWTAIVYLAGLQSIPEELLEAAAVDGANTWQKFRYITLPLLRTTLVYLLVVLVIGGLNAYVSFILVTHSGDPLDMTHSVLTWMTKVTFLQHRFGYGSAISYLLTLFVFLISLLQMRLLLRRTEN